MWYTYFYSIRGKKERKNITSDENKQSCDSDCKMYKERDIKILNRHKNYISDFLQKYSL